MKKWILFVIEVDQKLDKLALSLQNRAERLALDLVRPPLDVCRDIFAVNDLLARLVNLRVINKRFLSALCTSELDALLRLKKRSRFGAMYRNPLNAEDITAKTERARLQSSALRKCAQILSASGFNLKKLDADYASLSAELKSVGLTL